MQKTVRIGPIRLSNRLPFGLIAGPCVIEDRASAVKTARAVRDVTKRLGIPYIFKASYDKANRTSIRSFRGPGLVKGLSVLKDVKETVGVPVLTDVHTVEEIRAAADVVDILQIPAFLCRQTDLVLAAAETGKTVNIKKGQFLAPWDIVHVLEKIKSVKNQKILVTERGVSFGYNTLVSDFRSLDIMARQGYPVVFDATHSVQQPGGQGTVSGGQSEFIPLLARCAIAAGCAALFMEVHPNPRKAKSDGPNMLSLRKLEPLLCQLRALDRIVKQRIG